ncbi:XrtA/PEP-CTERM system TPR-repeat protein PrsT [Oxalobacteraceae bacterium A2-2]
MPDPIKQTMRRTALLATLLLATLLAACQPWRGDSELLAAARGYYARGEAQAAIIELKNLLQRSQGHADARLLLGAIYVDSGDLQSAEKEFRRAATLGQQQRALLEGLGYALLMQGHPQQLLDELPVAGCCLQPGLDVLRGLAWLQLNRPGQARAVFDAVLAAAPHHPGALLGQARLALAGQEVERALALAGQAITADHTFAEAWRFQADLLRQQGRFPEALAAHAMVLKLKPSQLLARIDLANLHIEMRAFALARKVLAEARRISANSVLLLYTQALLDFGEGRLKPAREQLQLVLRAAPEHLPAHLLMGAVQQGLGAPQEAGQHLRLFLDAHPGNPYASKLLAGGLLKQGEAAQALAVLGPLLPSGREDAQMMALAGEIHMRLKHYEQANEYFQAASTLAPGKAMYHAALGMSRIAMGDDGRAVEQLEQAAALDAGSTRAGVLLALTRMRSGQYDQALAAIARMQAQQPDNPLLHNLRGGVLLMKRDVAGARAAFERAVAAAPGYLPALDNLTELDLAEHQPERSRQRLEAALAKDKNNTALMTALSRLALNMGQPAAARDWLERAARDNPDAPEPSMRLANFYGRVGEHEKALLLAHKLQAADPASTDALALLAGLQLQAGQPREALDSYRKLELLQPRTAELQMRIAGARQAARDPAGALQAVKKALLLQPLLPQAQLALVQLLVQRRQHGDALLAARKFQQLRPDGALGYRLEADVLAAQGRHDAALALYRKAHGLHASADTLLPLQRGLRAAGRRGEGDSLVQAWLTAHPADQESRASYAAQLLADGREDESVRQYELVLARDPSHAAALNDLAWLYHRKQDPRALALAERAGLLAGGHPAVLDTLGWLLLEQGKVARALPLLQKAAGLAPAAPDIQFHLGVGLAKNGQRADARRQLAPLLTAKHYAHHDEVQAWLARL